MQSPSHIGATRLYLTMIFLPFIGCWRRPAFLERCQGLYSGLFSPLRPTLFLAIANIWFQHSNPRQVQNRVPSSAVVIASVYSACRSLYLPAHSCGCRAPSAPRIADVSFSAAPRSDSCEGAVAVIDGYRVTSRLYALLPRHAVQIHGGYSADAG